MKPLFIAAFVFSGLALSGCHKLGKKRCNDCPKWTEVKTQKPVQAFIKLDNPSKKYPLLGILFI